MALKSLYRIIFLCFAFSTLAQKKSESKPFTIWWWPGSAVDTANISFQIKKMASNGLGGVHIIPIYGVKGKEKNNIEFLSSKWIEMLKYCQKEAAKHGMYVDITPGTGWPYGAKYVTLQDAAGTLLHTKTKLSKGSNLVTISGIFRQQDSVYSAPLIGIVLKEKQKTTLLPLKLSQKIEIKDTGCYVYAFYSGKTLQKVKRAAPGSEGWVLDHFNKAAFKRYMLPFDTIQKMSIRALYADSYEVFGANWTDSLPIFFQNAKKYDIIPYLPLLIEKDTSELAKQVRTDLREVVSDVLENGFYKPMGEFAKQRNLLFRNQAHGASGNILDYYSHATIPETEIFGQSNVTIPGYIKNKEIPHFYGQPDILLQKFASSASHIIGGKLVSSETCTWLDDHFQVSLDMVKVEIDRLFLAGINHVVFHGSTYSPKEAAWPGWLFYASTNFNYNSHFWESEKTLNNYISNTQFWLQNSTFDADCWLYMPQHDLWANRAPKDLLLLESIHDIGEWFFTTPFENTASELKNQGTQFDYVSDKLLAKYGQSVNLPIVIPPCEYMPLATMKLFAELAKNGKKLYFKSHLPTKVAGKANDTTKTAFEKLKIEIATYKNVKIVSFLLETEIRREALLAQKRLEFIRKKDSNGKSLYFIANHTDKIVTLQHTLWEGKAQNLDLFLPGESKLISNFQNIEKSLFANHIMSLEPSKLEYFDGKMENFTIIPDTSWLGKIKSVYYEFSLPKSMLGKENLFSISGINGDILLIDKDLKSQKADSTFLCFLPKVFILTPKPGHKYLLKYGFDGVNRIKEVDKSGQKWKIFTDINFVDITYRPYNSKQKPWRYVPTGVNVLLLTN